MIRRRLTNVARRLVCRPVGVLLLVFLMPLGVYLYIGSKTSIDDQYSPTMSVRLGGRRVGANGTQTCVHPRLELWDDHLRTLFAPPQPLTCDKVERNWVWVDNGTFRIDADAVRRHASIACEYFPIRRGTDDFQVLLGNPIKPMEDGMRITSDVFKVKCTGGDGQTYTNILSAIAPNPEVIERSAEASSQLPVTSMHLNIIMFGFDSVSRMTWMRNLPKSYAYLVDHLGAAVLEGYNVVGDGTPQALLPILTGKTEPELPEARRGFAGARSVDGHPWLWKRLQDVGYVTQWGEESPNIGTFTYRMLGFRDQPVDHYMRTYYLAAEPHYSDHEPFCVGSVPRHRVMMRTMLDFVDAYPSHLRFSFVFHSEYSHEANSWLQWADDDLVAAFRHLEERGHLNDSVLVAMSDHGARFQNVRVSEQGKYEERLPFVAVRVPPSFGARFPDAERNLRQNVGRLTTPFDLHETLLDVVDFGRPRPGRTMWGDRRPPKRPYPRGFSLFDEIPLDRTCADADIEPHWCTCLDWQKVSLVAPEVLRSADEVIATVNNLTTVRENVCARLSVDAVTSAVRYSVRAELLKFKRSSDAHGRVADLTDDMKAQEDFYQVTLLARPSGALYEATVKHILSDDRYVVDVHDISRINKYGNQPHCVASQLPHLRAYCYCKTQL